MPNDQDSPLKVITGLFILAPLTEGEWVVAKIRNVWLSILSPFSSLKNGRLKFPGTLVLSIYALTPEPFASESEIRNRFGKPPRMDTSEILVKTALLKLYF